MAEVFDAWPVEGLTARQGATLRGFVQSSDQRALQLPAQVIDAIDRLESADAPDHHLPDADCRGVPVIVDRRGHDNAGRSLVRFNRLGRRSGTQQPAGWQAFIHRHPLGFGGRIRPWAHCHVFLRRQGADGDAVLSHLVAMAIDRKGRLSGLFSVNRWVTDESWQPAAAMMRELRRALESSDLTWAFEPPESKAASICEDLWPWIQFHLRLFEPELSFLLRHRDAVLAHRQARQHAQNPQANVFEDRSLEGIGFVRADTKRRLNQVSGIQARG